SPACAGRRWRVSARRWWGPPPPRTRSPTMPEPLAPSTLRAVLHTLTADATLDALPGHLRPALAAFVVTYNLACCDGRAWALLSQVCSWRQTRRHDAPGATARHGLHGRWN